MVAFDVHAGIFKRSIKKSTENKIKKIRLPFKLVLQRRYLILNLVSGQISIYGLSIFRSASPRSSSVNVRNDVPAVRIRNQIRIERYAPFV